MNDKLVFYHPSVLTDETLMRLAGVETETPVLDFKTHESDLCDKVALLVNDYVEDNDYEMVTSDDDIAETRHIVFDCAELVESYLSTVVSDFTVQGIVSAITDSDEFNAMKNDLRHNWHHVSPEQAKTYFHQMQGDGIEDRISPRMTPGQAQHAMRGHYDNMSLYSFLEELSNYMEN